MRPHTTFTRTAALAAALLLVSAATAGGQADTTRRDTTRARVPVAKERPAPSTPTSGVPVTKAQPAPRDTTTKVSAGEVALPRDTTPARVEPMFEAPRPIPTPLPALRRTRYLFGNSGFTMGLGAGAAMPAGTFRELGYDPGIHATLPVAWHRPGNVLGVRATFSFEKPTRGSSDVLRTAPGVPAPTADPRIYAATLDAVIRLPVLGMGADRDGLALYGVGGGGGYAFRDFGATSLLADALGGGVGKTRVTRWGVNAGGGLEWGMGATAAFVEARWVNVFADGSRAGNDYLRWVPVVVGLTVR